MSVSLWNQDTKEKTPFIDIHKMSTKFDLVKCNYVKIVYTHTI